MPAEQSTRSNRRWLVWGIRIAVLLLVGYFVRGTVVNALERLSHYDWHVRPAWLVAAGAFYVFGLVPMAWFWWRTLASLGQPAPWPATLHAYFIGHLGKYVPGKALAVILRVAAVGKWVRSIRVALVSTLMETLTMMAVGACLAAVLSAIVLKLDWQLTLVAMAMAAGCVAPTLPPVARWLAKFGAMRFKRAEATDQPNDDAPAETSQPSTADQEFAGIRLPLLASGWLSGCICWLLLGLSLGATLRAIGAPNLDMIAQLPLLVAAVAFAVVGGFASMLPGGLGVRDLLLMQLLAPQFGDTNALVAAVLVRLVWLVSELLACVILYIGVKINAKRP